MMNQDVRRTIFHVDADAFFASVEEVLHPRLRGKPVIVGGPPSARGVVAAASYEARRFGVRAAMPLARAYRLCPQAVFLPGSFHEYKRFSDRIFESCRSFSPVVETASLDEAFLDMTGAVDARDPAARRADGLRTLFGHPLETAEQLKQAIRAATGLSVSVGIAANKLVAKIASGFAKPGGIAWVKWGGEAAFLAGMNVGDIPGVGRATVERLSLLNVDRVAALRTIPEKLLRRTFGVAGETLFQYAWGRDNRAVEARTLPRSIGRETTFEHDTCDREIVSAMLWRLVARAARQVRSLHMTARTVSVKLRFVDFSIHVKSASLPEGDRHDHVFFQVAERLLDRLWHRRMRVRLVGVTLSKLSQDVGRQGDFFQGRRYEKARALYSSIDRIRDRFGFAAIAQGRAVHCLGKPS